eukprot:TRINITY_DN5880_c0_g1_i1.p1 TRINITY_DN5880_c0_g1~~TRINITY_DN5880_c0_g1_i1.p1  ORF type:complete len:170 (-),score=25.56 TRINITY_DN5880_c0_g1_i1:291-800(-)
MGLDFGGSASNQAQPSNTQHQQNNSGFGGDLLGFGGSTASQPPQQTHQPPNQQNPNQQGGGDLMGFSFDNPQPQQNTPPQSPGLSSGFSFDSSPAQSPTYQQPKQPQQHQQPQGNNFGFDLMGGNDQPAPAVNKPPQANTGFTPIQNTNPNKIMAYENQHVQIWMDCIK